MKKALRLVALVAMVAMVAAMAIVPTAASGSAVNSWKSSDGKFEIGFFDFDESGVAEYLVIKAHARPAGFAIASPIALAGITRMQNWEANGELENAAAGVTNAENTTFAGAITSIFEWSVGDWACRSKISGKGTVTFGEGAGIGLIYEGDPTSIVYPELAGMAFTNERIGGVDTTPADTDPVDTDPVTEPQTQPQTEPQTQGTQATQGTLVGGKVPGRNSNYPYQTTGAASNNAVPRGGVVLAIVPTLLAAGAAVVASRKRK